MDSWMLKVSRLGLWNTVCAVRVLLTAGGEHDDSESARDRLGLSAPAAALGSALCLGQKSAGLLHAVRGDGRAHKVDRAVCAAKRT